MIWVDVFGLEGGEEELNRSCIVAVGPGVEHRYLEALHQSQCRFAGVVAGVVEQDHCVLTPVGTLAIQFQHQLPQEDVHHPVVGVGLQQRQVDLSIGVQANEHGDPGVHRSGWNRVGGVLLSPFHPAEIAHAQPCLVHVDDPFATMQKLDELLSELLSQHQVTLGVGIQGNLLDLPVSHPQVLLEDLG